MGKPHRHTIKDSFSCAGRGAVLAFLRERSLRLQVGAAVIAIAAGFLLKINQIEWLAVIFSIGLVITTETLNTAIEATVDLACDAQHELARLAKDTAAGAALLASITAAIIGVITFTPKLAALLRH